MPKRTIQVKLYRYGIFAALALDGLCSVAVLIDVYFVVTRLHGASPTFLRLLSGSWLKPLPGESHPTGTMPAITILSYFPATISQTFFMYRYYTMYVLPSSQPNGY